MGSINSLAQTVQEILLNNYLAINNFENSEIRNFVPNWTRTHNHLVHKRTLNHLAKLARWLSCVVSTYLYGALWTKWLWIWVQL